MRRERIEETWEDKVFNNKVWRIRVTESTAAVLELDSWIILKRGHYPNFKHMVEVQLWQRPLILFVMPKAHYKLFAKSGNSLLEQF